MSFQHPFQLRGVINWREKAIVEVTILKQKNSEHFQKQDDQSIFEVSLNGGHGDLLSTTVVFELVCLIFLLTVLVQSLYVQADKTNFFLKKTGFAFPQEAKSQNPEWQLNEASDKDYNDYWH